MTEKPTRRRPFAIRHRYSILCENGHEFMSFPDQPDRVARYVQEFLEDGCRCKGVLGGVYRYGVDRKGRSGPGVLVTFDILELP